MKLLPFIVGILLLGPVPTGAHDGREHATRPPQAAAREVPSSTAAPAALPFAFGGPFALVDHHGVARSDRDFRGQYLLIFFGYASCRSMCPIALGRMIDAYERLGRDGARLRPILISIDPARDTPDRLRAAAAKLHPRLLGLTGTPASVRAAARAYNVQYAQVTSPGDADPIFAHGSYVYLVKPDGGFATLLPPVLGAEAMARTIRRYMDPEAGG